MAYNLALVIAPLVFFGAIKAIRAWRSSSLLTSPGPKDDGLSSATTPNTSSASRAEQVAQWLREHDGGASTGDLVRKATNLMGASKSTVMRALRLARESK